MGAIAFHLYAGNRYDLGKLRALGRKYGIPLWMTEYSLSAAGFNKRAYQLRGRDPIYWAVLMNDLIVNYDVSAIDYMMGFNGEWGERRFPGAQLIVLEHDGLAYQGFRRTKQYYVMGQFSRFIEPGARRVKTEGAHGDIRVSAFRKGADMTVVGINTGMFPRRVMFAFTPGSLSPSARFRATRGRKTKPSNDAPQAEISSSFGLDRN